MGNKHPYSLCYGYSTSYVSICNIRLRLLLALWIIKNVWSAWRTAKIIHLEGIEMTATLERQTTQREMVADGFANLFEASMYLRISRSAIYILMNAGELPFAKFGKSRRIPWEALRDYGARSMVGANK
jgi:excisionase family DNA binding protein